MRELDKPDTPGLGKKIEKPVPQPVVRQVTDKIVKDADGKLRTNIPANEAANWTWQKLMELAIGSIPKP